MTAIENVPFFMALGMTEYMSICMNADTENYLDLYTKPMTGLFAGSLLAIEPVTRMVLIVKLSDKGIDTADIVGALPRSLPQAKKLIASLGCALFDFKVFDVCLN